MPQNQTKLIICLKIDLALLTYKVWYTIKPNNPPTQKPTLPTNCVETNDYYKIGIFILNIIIVYKLLVLRILSWNFNCLQIIISYLNTYS